MTRAASQAGDADSFRTPGLNSSVQTSMNDRGVPYYWRQNESAWLIRYLILAVKSCQDSLNLNKREDDTSNMSWNLKYSAWIAKRVTTDTFLHAHMNYLGTESHFVGVHGPYELHRKEKQIKCTALAVHENLLFFPMQFIWPVNTDKMRFSTYIYIF